MQTLKAEGLFTSSSVCAHINHQLRGAEADADEEFVIAQAHSLSLPIETRRIDVRGFAHENKLSIETAARQLRLESLLDIAKADNCNCIATGHQKNDNAETILQRLARGTGFRGLGGIWPKRLFADDIKFVRPLLCVSRDEILQYLNKRSLKWRVDHTNYHCTYRRNFIRHRLMPALQQDCNNSIVEQLFSLSQSARRFYDLVCEATEKVWSKLADCSGDELKLDLEIFSNQPEPAKIELIRKSLTSLGSKERGLTRRHYEKILQLAKQNVSDRKVELPNRFTARHEYGNLIFARPQMPEVRNQKSEVRNLSSVVLEIPGQTRFGPYLIEATILDAGCSMLDTRRKIRSRIENRESRIQLVERFDLDKVKLPLVVRFRQAGDRFWPLGLASEKKIGKFVTAAKVPHQLRQKMLVIADSEKVIWLWPIRISEKAKITSETQRILQLQITNATLAEQ